MTRLCLIFIYFFFVILKKELNTCDLGLNLQTAFRAEISALAVREIDLWCDNFLPFECFSAVFVLNGSINRFHLCGGTSPKLQEWKC